ncbi:MAG TPA: hypothetical protein VHK27_04120 [Gammaproteobacteria bacterium]|nr:hypothetical protein [Gammaproteobacteria bacterium]
MDTQLSGDATRRTRQTQQEGGENPMHQRAFAVGQQRMGEIVEGAPTASAPVAFASGSVVVSAPGTYILAGTTGTLQWAIFPPQRMDVCLTVFGTEESVYI